MNPQQFEEWQKVLIIWGPLVSPLATLVVVMLGFIYNNARLSDLNNRFSDMSSRLSDLKTFLIEMIRANDEKQTANLSRVEDMLLHKFAELDNRLVRLENRLPER